MPGLPQIRHLGYSIPMAVGLYLVRWTCEKYLFAPLGLWLGLKSTPNKKAPPNEFLEKKYGNARYWKHDDVKGLAKQLDISEREIEIWLRIRRKQDRKILLDKFCESAWRFTYYTFAFLFGLTVLWDKPWLWNIQECWTGFPNQPITDGIWYYYLISLSVYVSLSVSQFFDVKRKDFWQMFAHHVITIVLIAYSWSNNCIRLGTLVLVVHDCTDIFLEFTKMASYLKSRMTDVSFGLLLIVWITTRLGVFPLWIIRHTLFDAPKFPNLIVYQIFLSSLTVLHIFWTYVMFKILVKSLKAGHVENDIRSEDSSTD